MRKNEIKGIKPFNSIRFDSCFYHQLITGLSCLEVNQDTLLLSCVSYIHHAFQVEKKFFLEDLKFAKKIGYKTKKFHVSQKNLIKSIDKGCPLLVGVDYYYLESNAETYMKRRAPHFILVYGYDLDKGEAKVVDHDYVNSPEYVSSSISLENLLYASKMLKRSRYKNRFIGYQIKKTKGVKGFSIWDYIDIDGLMKNQEESLKNIKHLKELLSTDLDGLQKRSEDIMQYLQDIKTFYLIYSNITCIAGNSQRAEIMSCLISAYSNLISLFFKMKLQDNYEYARKMLNSILRKLDEIVGLEERFYTYVLEAVQ